MALAAVSIASMSSADATTTAHGQFLEGATTLDQWEESDAALLNAVEQLTLHHNMNETDAKLRLVTEDPDRSVYGLTSTSTVCLIEVAPIAGISSTCAAAEEVAERGLFIARFVPDPADPTAVISADVITAAPASATSLAGVPDNSVIAISGSEIVSVRYDSSQLESVTDLVWHQEDGVAVSVGITLPSF